MPEYINPNNYVVHLTGPDGKVVRIKGLAKAVLPDYFEKYCQRGFIRKTTDHTKIIAENKIVNQAALNVSKLIQKRISKQEKPIVQQTVAKQTVNRQSIAKKSVTTAKIDRIKRQNVVMHRVNNDSKKSKNIVGRQSHIDPLELLKNNLSESHYPISNGIGIGILSYNRGSSLSRLIDSIIRNTDLRKTTVFISDDASTDPETIKYLDLLSKNNNFVVLRNNNRLGVAGNSNRLLKCLDRFNHCILLNDDVEILSQGWDKFYFDIMNSTGMHHFIYRQSGVYSANRGALVTKNGIEILKTVDKPHGAVLAFTHDAFTKIGYFDESYGIYGMEHVDWSQRIYELGLQDPGFFDVGGSESFFLIHNQESSVENRSQLFQSSKEIFKNRVSKYVEPTNDLSIPTVTYIIPFRNFERTNSISTVVNNIRAQKYPIIDIVMVEHDSSSNLDRSKIEPVRYYLYNSGGGLFNKSKAFNLGVYNAKYEKIILHDADMLAQGHYTTYISAVLDDYEACHVGKSVIYTTEESMNEVNDKLVVDDKSVCDRIVGYYEGGSLGCTKSGYMKIGGFNEDYSGYGCFLPGNYVLTNTGYKTIESVCKSDLLFTHKHEYQSIDLRSRQYDGNVYDIYVPGRLPIKGVTPNHPFLVETNDGLIWRRADELKIDDVIASTDHLPDLIPNYDLSSIALLDKSKNSFDIYQMMDQFCYLLGLYLADGVLQTSDRLRIIYYYLNETEEFLAKYVENLVKQLHPDINTTYHYVKNGCREVRVFNSLLAKNIAAVAGKFGATQKIISQRFVNELTNKQLSLLLGGGCDGDANHSNGSEKRVVYHTSSIDLAMSYSAIMRRLGIAHSFGKRNGGSFVGSSEYTFDLCVNREFEHLIYSQYSKPAFIGSNSVGRSKFGVVYDIKQRHYSGIVYNFEVDVDHSYVVNGLIVHNCEDCDFYARASRGLRWKENRVFDFLHLWHSRTPGWNNHHEENKILEARLSKLDMNKRIDLQLEQLKNFNY